MANHFSASIYSFDNGYDSITQLASMGVINSFPSATTYFYPAPAGTTGGSPTTVAINAIIAVLPQGLRVKSEKFYTSKTVAELETLANA